MIIQILGRLKVLHCRLEDTTVDNVQQFESLENVKPTSLNREVTYFTRLRKYSLSEQTDPKRHSTNEIVKTFS